MGPPASHSMNSADLPQSGRLPADVVKLGFVSLLTDLSSEIIFSVFAVSVPYSARWPPAGF